MSRGMTRADRLQEMERLYLQRAYSDIEMAERLSTPEHRVDRTTVFRDRAELETRVPFSQDKNGRYLIDRVRYLPNIRVNLCEALSLYLAARRASQQTHSAQRHTASALEKLALTLKQPMTQRLVKAADVILQQKARPERDKVFEVVADAWVQGLRLRVRYQGLHAKQPYDDMMSPYLIEPSPWSDSVYVIGPSDRLGKIVPYKLDRIQHAALSSERFVLPEDFDEPELLRHAWGIWRGDGEPVTVKLKFASGEAARRVQESVWHPLEQVTPAEDGGCLWQAPIAEPREMLPWVRGWGSDCTVLEPEGLRQALRCEARKLARLYGISTEQSSPRSHWLLWGKTNRPRNDHLHLLICHLIDVGNVAREMWTHVFTNGFKQQIADALALSSDDAGRLIAFLAAMHDLGKACPSFQKKLETKDKLRKHYEAIVSAGFSLTDTGESCPHGYVSTFALRTLLEICLPSELARKVAIVVGGHHGRWPTTSEWSERASCAGKDKWNEARKALAEDVRSVFEPPALAQYTATSQQAENMLLVALSGITAVVDWLGSMENPFGYVETMEDLDEYAADSAEKARLVLEREGWMQWQPPDDTKTFSELFERKTPRQSQERIIELAQQFNVPSLVIIEDATGSGKTESALYLADYWARMLGNRGAYVAMPTMATSNQMHDRFNKVLETRYPSSQIKAILVHSQARLAVDEPERKMQSNGENGSSSEVDALAWFEDHRKRSLLAPFGVGTVDQTFLSVLQTNHFFVKLFALGRKTVIFDEVHAYDTYMTTIFQTLLQWLRAMGSSVVILSATLPVATRQKLVSAYSGDASKAGNVEWSSVVTWVSGETTDQEELPAAERPTVRMEWIGHAPEGIAQRLRQEISDSGCVAVICNRVARAQEVYRAIREELKDDPHFVPGDNLLLFHARFPQVWRDEREKQVRRLADRDSKRDRPFIIVATQVIEQSLDLDFDLIVTDLPPMDLLIQRIGRLHRHREHDKMRPQNMRDPRVLITRPEQEGEAPKFGKDERLGSRGGVYERYVLLRTYLELKRREQDDAVILALPAQSRELIETVYAGEDKMPDFSAFTTEQQQALRQSWMQMRQGGETDKRKANLRTIEEPQEQLIYMDSLELTDDDSPQTQAGLNAMTRLCLPTVQLVCLVRKPSGSLLLLLDDKQEVVDLTRKPSGNLAKRLARCAVPISQPSVVEYFVGQKTPVGWQEHSVLKHYRAAGFAEEPDASLLCRLTSDLSLRLTQERGVEIE
jgi:CRISPR-associated endonuclease/helicase Cas3